MLLRASHSGHIHAKPQYVNINRKEFFDFARQNNFAEPRAYGDHAAFELLPLVVTLRTPDPSKFIV